MSESRIGFFERAKPQFTPEELDYMERVAGVPWPTSLVRFMTYRGDSGSLKPRYAPAREYVAANSVRNRHVPTVDLGFILRRVKYQAAFGLKRELQSLEDEVRAMRDAAVYRRNFVDRREDA